MFESLFIVLFLCSTSFLLGMAMGYYIKSEKLPKPNSKFDGKINSVYEIFGKSHKKYNSKGISICCECDI